MTAPPAEHRITEQLVRTLLTSQCPQWADLPLTLLGEGWDNVMYRLGDELVVRLPRRQLAVACLQIEQRWLADLADPLPVPIPVPIHHGTPTADYPWPWSVVPHLPGRPQAETLAQDQTGLAIQLADFFALLHQVAPADLEASSVRGVPLARRATSFGDWVAALPQAPIRRRAERAWNRALAADPHRGAPRVLHGDPHPLNLLVDHGELSAVIDFGDLTPGDPACDLGIATLGLREPERQLFRDRIDAHRDRSQDPDLWLRADGWALYEAVIFAVTAEPGSLEGQIAERALTTLGVLPVPAG